MTIEFADDGVDLSEMTEEALDLEIARQRQIVAKQEELGAFMLFKPFPFQVPWYRSTKKLRILLCGNQVGKTTFGCITMLSACLGVRPLCFGGVAPTDWGKIRHQESPHKYLACGDSYSALAETIIQKLDDFLDPSMMRRRPKIHSPAGVSATRAASACCKASRVPRRLGCRLTSPCSRP